MPIDRPMVTAVVCLLTAALTSASERSLYRLKIICTREAKLSAGPSGPGGRAFLFDIQRWPMSAPPELWGHSDRRRSIDLPEGVSVVCPLSDFGAPDRGLYPLSAGQELVGRRDGADAVSVSDRRRHRR